MEKLRINKEYAKKFEERKKREELSKCKDWIAYRLSVLARPFTRSFSWCTVREKYGDADDEESSTSEDEDENAEARQNNETRIE